MDGAGIQIIYMLVFGAISAAVASSKGRSAVGWFFGGFFLTLIGLIIVACLSNLKDEARKRDQDQAERRRLREQLRQERMKNEAYRRHASARLDAHDQHLGLDTRAVASLPEGHGDHGRPHELGSGGADPLTSGRSTSGHDEDPAFRFAGGGSPIPSATADTSRVKEWFYELRGESRGPVSEAAIRAGLANGRIDGETLVWREGMANWQAVGELPLFATSFRG